MGEEGPILRRSTNDSRPTWEGAGRGPAQHHLTSGVRSYAISSSSVSLCLELPASISLIKEGAVNQYFDVNSHLPAEFLIEVVLQLP